VLSKSALFPAWSPDGRQLAFIYIPTQGPEAVIVANADGSGRHTVDIVAGGLSLGWSPDGRSIVTTDGDRVRVVNANGTQAKVIAYPGPEHEVDDPAWQPLP
jgi:Tol biopolymer transport system component